MAGGKSKSKRVSKKRVHKTRRKSPKGMTPKESLEHLLHQKEEIETLLSSLEDSYNEAAITDEDYEHVKEKNEEKLAEINKKIEKLRASGTEEKTKPRAPAPAPAPVISAPVTPPAYTKRPAEVVKKVVKEVKKPVAKAAKAVERGEDIKNIMKDMETKISESVRDVIEAAKVEESGKELKDIRVKLDRLEVDTEKLKAVVETIKEGRNVFDEKIQRVTDSVAELRSIVYQREAALKDQEVKVSKLLDAVSHVEPEKIAVEMKRRDKIVSEQGIKIEKMARTIETLNETMRRLRNVLANLGSLENVVKVSNTVNQTLQEMQTLRDNMEKSADRIQSIYVELSERMEEFLLYRTKQDRMEDLVNELMRNVDEMNTKLSKFVTRDDLEAFRQSIQASAGAPAGGGADVDELQIQKEEIKMLLQTLEDEYRSKRISKEEYETAKKANMDKLDGIERKIKEAETGQASAPAGQMKPPSETSGITKEAGEKPEIKVPPPTSEKTKKERQEALLKDLEDTFKKGFISKDAYEKTKKMILSGKG